MGTAGYIYIYIYIISSTVVFLNPKALYRSLAFIVYILKLDFEASRKQRSLSSTHPRHVDGSIPAPSAVWEFPKIRGGGVAYFGGPL